MNLADDAIEQVGKLFVENQELRSRLAQIETEREVELEKAFRKGWADCAVHARRETDTLLDEMARDFTENARARRLR